MSTSQAQEPKAVVDKSTYRDLAAKNPNFTETDVLNAANPSKSPRADSDVTVIGGGIHGLIYSLHAGLKPSSDDPLKISIFEKSPKPLHKIGESTLPPFSTWIANLGLDGEVLLRIFGFKGGLEFYILDRNEPEGYTDFASGGLPGFFLAGFQVERPISELLLTLFAQRHGIDVWHGHQADIQKTVLSAEGDVIPIKNVAAGTSVETKSPLVVDGTGRFRQIGSKYSRVKRFDGWNTDAFWAYFECKDEKRLPDVFRFFEAQHTNHICFPEGWIWIIRLPSWQGSPIPNLMDMIHYLLDHAEAGTPSDQIPSTYELAEMFGCKVQWIWSIGYAVRNDVQYPDISGLGNSEAERRFNFYANKYPKIKEFMAHFTVIENQYGPGTTWTIRKQLTYQTQVVSGPGWLTIGDGVGFTNPLHSPGISAGMGSSTYAADLTREVLSKKTEEERRAVLKPYDDWCEAAIPALNQLNVFNYVCFKDTRLAPQVSLLWVFFAGLGEQAWRLMRQSYHLDWDTFLGHNLNWLWGARCPEFETVAKKAIELLNGPVDEVPSEAAVNEVLEFSNKLKEEVVASGRFGFRWHGLLRYFNLQLEYDVDKYPETDIFANTCKACGTWHMIRADWRKCYTCGVTRDAEDCEIGWRPELKPEEIGMLVHAADPKAIGRPALEYLAAQKTEVDAQKTEVDVKA